MNEILHALVADIPISVKGFLLSWMFTHFHPFAASTCFLYLVARVLLS